MGKQLTKRVWAWILTACMLLSMMPSAVAEDVTADPSVDIVEVVDPAAEDVPAVDEDLPVEEEAPETDEVPDVSAPETTEPETTEPEITAPADDEPVVEEPVEDEPVVDEPVADEPALGGDLVVAGPVENLGDVLPGGDVAQPFKLPDTCPGGAHDFVPADKDFSKPKGEKWSDEQKAAAVKQGLDPSTPWDDDDWAKYNKVIEAAKCGPGDAATDGTLKQTCVFGCKGTRFYTLKAEYAHNWVKQADADPGTSYADAMAAHKNFAGDCGHGAVEVWFCDQCSTYDERIVGEPTGNHPYDQIEEKYVPATCDKPAQMTKTCGVCGEVTYSGEATDDGRQNSLGHFFQGDIFKKKELEEGYDKETVDYHKEFPIPAACYYDEKTGEEKTFPALKVTICTNTECSGTVLADGEIILAANSLDEYVTAEEAAKLAAFKNGEAQPFKDYLEKYNAAIAENLGKVAKIEVTAAGAHVKSADPVTDPATCEHAERLVFKCTQCGFEMEKVELENGAEKLPHEYVETPVDENGKKIAATPFMPEQADQAVAAKHVMMCKNGCEQVKEGAEPVSCSYEETLSAPTCTEKNALIKKCACGNTYTITAKGSTELVPHEFSLVAVPAKDAELGKVSYTSESEIPCGIKVKWVVVCKYETNLYGTGTYPDEASNADRAAIDALMTQADGKKLYTPHTWAAEPFDNGWCDGGPEEGQVSKEYWVCTNPNCSGETFEDDSKSELPEGATTVETYDPAANHNRGAGAKVAAVKNIEAGAKPDHTAPADGEITYENDSKKPTCTKEGEGSYVCTVCGKSVTATVPATGHTYDGQKWDETLVPATCTTASYYRPICAVCGEAFGPEKGTEAIKDTDKAFQPKVVSGPLGHTWATPGAETDYCKDITEGLFGSERPEEGVNRCEYGYVWQLFCTNEDCTGVIEIAPGEESWKSNGVGTLGQDIVNDKQHAYTTSIEPAKNHDNNTAWRKVDPATDPKLFPKSDIDPKHILEPANCQYRAKELQICPICGKTRWVEIDLSTVPEDLQAEMDVQDPDYTVGEDNFVAFSGEDPVEKAQHKVYCASCMKIYEGLTGDEKIAKDEYFDGNHAGHVNLVDCEPAEGAKVTEVAATCTTPAYKEFTCKDCKADVKLITGPVDENAHVPGKTEMTSSDAACGAEVTYTTKCILCNKTIQALKTKKYHGYYDPYTGKLKDPATDEDDNDFSYAVTKDPTCLTDGVGTYTCNLANCPAKTTDQAPLPQVIPAVGAHAVAGLDQDDDTVWKTEEGKYTVEWKAPTGTEFGSVTITCNQLNCEKGEGSTFTVAGLDCAAYYALLQKHGDEAAQTEWTNKECNMVDGNHQAATCTTPARTGKKCANCPATEEMVDDPDSAPLGHNWVKKTVPTAEEAVSVDPNCLDDGTYIFTCSVCANTVYEEDAEEFSKKEASYDLADANEDNLKFVKADSYEKGVGATLTVTVKATGHKTTWENEDKNEEAVIHQAANCLQDEADYLVCTNENCPGVGKGTVTGELGEGGEKTYQIIEVKFKDGAVATGHKWKEAEEGAGTEENGWKHTLICANDNCPGYNETWENNDNANGYDESKKKATWTTECTWVDDDDPKRGDGEEATCVSGAKTPVKCEYCTAKSLREDGEPDYDNHDFTYEWLTEPTCTTAGIGKRSCTREGCTYTPNYVKIQAHHSYVDEEGNPQLDEDHANEETAYMGPDGETGNVTMSCTKDGFKWWSCKNCGTEVEGHYISETVPATGHKFDKTKEPTEKKGTEATQTTFAIPPKNVWVCENDWCEGNIGADVDPSLLNGANDTYDGKAAISKVNYCEEGSHVYAEVKTEPTCVDEGVTVSACSQCGKWNPDSEPETVPAKGHDWGWKNGPASFDDCTKGENKIELVCQRGDCPAAGTVVPFEGAVLGYDTGTKHATLTITVTDHVTYYEDALGDWLIGQKLIDGSDTIARMPDCVNNGYEFIFCELCSAKGRPAEGGDETAFRALTLEEQKERCVTAIDMADDSGPEYAATGDHKPVKDGKGNTYIQVKSDITPDMFRNCETIEKVTDYAASTAYTGTHAQYCYVCGQMIGEAEACTMDEATKEDVAATCKEGAYTKFSCTICGVEAVKKYTSEPVPEAHPGKLGENEFAENGKDYTRWDSLSEAGCTTIGIYRVVCTLCGTVMGYVKAAIGHTFDNDHRIMVSPTCQEEGAYYYFCTKGEEEKCDDPATNHKAELPTEVTNDPNFETLGKGGYKKEAIPAKNPGHVNNTTTLKGTWNSKDGQFTVEFTYCYDCKEVTDYKLTKGEVVYADPDHSFNCNDISDSLNYHVTKHLGEVIEVPRVESTEDKAGHEAGTVCSFCGAIIDGCGELLPPCEEHTFTTQYELVPATHVKNGQIKKTCDVCGYVEYSDNPDAPATGHTWTLMNEGDMPTNCTDNWARKYQCVAENCGATADDQTGTAKDKLAGDKVEVDEIDFTTWNITLEDGVATYTTAEDDNWLTDKGVKGHDYSVTGDTVPATCEDAEYTKMLCSRCGAEDPAPYEAAKGQGQGHAWTEQWKNETPAEDEKPGALVHTHAKFCTNPGCEYNEENYTKETWAAYEGDVAIYESGAEVATMTGTEGNCTVAGTEVWTCEDCGYEKSFEGETNPDKHVFDEGKTEDREEADCVHDGYKVKVCDLCNQPIETEKVTIPAHGHNFPEEPSYTEGEATCEEGEYQVFLCQNEDCPGYDKDAEDNKGAVDEEDDKAYKIGRGEPDPTNHIYNEEPDETTDATCSEPGYKIWHCQNKAHKDDSQYDKKEADPTKPADPSKHVISGDTPSDEGNAVIKYCTVCGEVLEVVSGLDEDITDCTKEIHYQGKPAPHTFSAEEEGCEKTCTICSTKVGMHTWTHKDEVPVTEANCTEPATYNLICSKCSEEKIGSLDTDLPDPEKHVFDFEGEYETEGTATCVTPNQHVFTCTKCEVATEKRDGEYDYTDNGHSYGEPVVTPATCTTGAVTTYTCEREGCQEKNADHGYQKVETSEEKDTKFGHNYVQSHDGDTIVYDESKLDEGNAKAVKATCTNPGTKVYVCTLCGEETEGHEALVEYTVGDGQHHYTEGEYEIDEEAEPGKPGKRHQVCTVCGEETEPEEYEYSYDSWTSTVKSMTVLRSVAGGDNSTRVCMVKQGDGLTVIGETTVDGAKWYRVRLTSGDASGREGWLPERYVQPKD